MNIPDIVKLKPYETKSLHVVKCAQLELPSGIRELTDGISIKGRNQICCEMERFFTDFLHHGSYEREKLISLDESDGIKNRRFPVWVYVMQGVA